MQLTKKFLKEREQTIITIFGFILIAIISFEAGYLRGQRFKESPLVIEKPAIEAKETPAEVVPAESNTETLPKNPPAESPASSSLSMKNCPFVGSKNSDKYYPPDCQWAKRIKSENLVCFSSAEDARQKGYQPAKGCAK